jgi:hypothetical protein
VIRVDAFVLAVIFVACASGGQNQVSDQGNRVEQYRAAIGLDQLREPGGPNSGVVVHWPSPVDGPPLDGAEWEVASTDIVHLEDGAEGEWILKKGSETILLRIFVAVAGVEPARERLLGIATSTMMTEIPFKRTDPTIGALSVNVPSDKGGDFVWIFRNTCFHVRGIDTGNDVEAFARWIQSIAESGVVEDLGPHLPPLARVEADPATVKVDGTVTVKGTLSGGTETDRYSVDFHFDEEVLEMDEEDAATAKFTALAPGETKVTVHVVDRETLLSKQGAAVIKVEE